MRHTTRLFGIALIGLVALAGGALALGVTMNGNANATADAAGHHADGKGVVSASDKGVSASAGAHAGPLSGDASITGTLPQAPAMPPLPQPGLPTLPDLSGSASGGGSGSGDVTVP